MPLGKNVDGHGLSPMFQSCPWLYVISDCSPFLGLSFPTCPTLPFCICILGRFLGCCVSCLGSMEEVGPASCLEPFPAPRSDVIGRGTILRSYLGAGWLQQGDTGGRQLSCPDMFPLARSLSLWTSLGLSCREGVAHTPGLAHRDLATPPGPQLLSSLWTPLPGSRPWPVSYFGFPSVLPPASKINCDHHSGSLSPGFNPSVSP